MTERKFRRYLECGILAHGFARARCPDCGHDFIITYSCKGRGICPSCTTRRMAETAAHLTDHVFSLDTSVRIEAHDRQGLERLLRYCARPVFAQERLRQLDPEHLVYESKKPGPGGKVSVLLTPHQLLDRLSALIPPPRRHRHRYYDVLAPNSPYRPAVTVLAAAESACNEGKAEAETEETPVRQAARYVWAQLLARFYEVFPLICPKCGGDEDHRPH